MNSNPQHDLSRRFSPTWSYLRAGVAVFALLLFVAFTGVQAQDAAKPADGNTTEQPKKDDGAKTGRDGHDRPTTYPKIKFGGKKSGDGDEPKAADSKLKIRVYLLDISNAMAKSITVDESRETTRLEHMVAQMERSLDALAKRKDPRLRFNIVTFGSVQDFAAGDEPQAATEENAKRAKEWLKKLEAKGDADIYTMLSECFEQEPESATMIVGGMPGKPAKLDKELQALFDKEENAGEFLIKQVKEWRTAGKKTTLDITGVGLSADEKAYYKRLAEAAGGTYLDA
ncbi:MAG: hypothetical protein H6839_05440 [Planctomycetes bacterium]|nr:hypothetical protein [Planctomycetota bacterium]